MDWICVRLKVKGTYICILVVYLTHGVGIRDINVYKLEQVILHLKTLHSPVMLIGDWNVEPDELQDSYQGQQLKNMGFVLRTLGEVHTCVSGRKLDYALYQHKFAPIFQKLFQAEDTPWTAHVGIEGVIPRAPKSLLVRRQIVPRALPAVVEPRITWQQARDRCQRLQTGPKRMGEAQLYLQEASLIVDSVPDSMELAHEAWEFAATLEEWTLQAGEAQLTQEEQKRHRGRGDAPGFTVGKILGLKVEEPTHWQRQTLCWGHSRPGSASGSPERRPRKLHTGGGEARQSWRPC